MATGNYYEEHKGSGPIYRPQPAAHTQSRVYPSEMVPAKPTARKEKKKHQKAKKNHRPLRTFFRWCLLLMLILMIGGAGIGGIFLHQILLEAPSLDPMTLTPAQSATYICDSSGNKLQKLTLPEANRDLVSIQQVPLDLQHAFVAIEDSRFYTHKGIDPIGIARAVITGITTRNFSEGASTITQQLLKNSIFTGWTLEQSFSQRLRRKIQEQYLALRLEKRLSKAQILEDYMNIINLGAGCYGVQAAAFRYFGKDVSELTLSECAVIAGITQNPTRFNPITNPRENAARRTQVLDRMCDQGYISREAKEQALSDNVYERISYNDAQIDVSASIYSYYEDALIDQVINDLMHEKDYTYKQAYNAVYTGGLRIWSAQDPALQAACDAAFSDPSNFPEGTKAGIDYALSIESAAGEITHYGNDALLRWVQKTTDPAFHLLCDTTEQARALAEGFKNAMLQEGDTLLGERVTITPQPQASAVIIQQSTGQVKAIVGGRGDKEASLTLNRATYTTRQPGSTFKILTAFAPALSEGGQTLATVYPGTYAYADGTPVSNWDLKGQSADATMREAIVSSINTAAVACITQITPQLGFDYAKAFGITTLVERYEGSDGIHSDIIQPLALGGITKGVTNLELCGAYACIANEGSYIQPRFYTQVMDVSGNLLLDHTQPAKRTVLRPAVAALLTDAMTDVISDPKGTACQSIDLGAMAAAGKTGTTSDYRDIWFAGYTPYYTCCIWGGYDNNDVLPEDSEGETEGMGHTYCKVLWNAIMQQVHKDLSPRNFTLPYSVSSVSLCRDTHMVASPACADTYEEYFEIGGAALPDHYCNLHGNGRQVDVITAQTDASLAGEEITVTTSDQAIWPAPEGSISSRDIEIISISNQGNTAAGENTFPQNQQQEDIVIFN